MCTGRPISYDPGRARFLVRRDAPALNLHTALANLRPTSLAAQTAACRIAVAPRLAGGPEDEDDDATRPAPLADIHIDLPDEGTSDAADTLVELPMDDDADNGDTLRMPL